MIYRFAAFGLDEDKKILRSSNGELALQPRVFDLLQYLLRHRDRVVSKDELVEEVWEGAFVTDAAVQRAVSVLRSALRDGESETPVIRTHPRQGYRFCAEVVEEEARELSTTAAEPAALAEARAAFDRRDWVAAMEGFREADRDRGLEGNDLERWGTACDYAGFAEQALVPLERAVAAFSAARSRCDAGRVALRLANAQLERREGAVGSGWLRRAARYLEGAEPCHEVAMLGWLRARFALFSGELDEALRLAETAYEMAVELEDRDVEALTLLYRGLSLTGLGKLKRGMALIDESAAAVLAEGLDSWMGGIVYCGVIWTYLNLGDWRRAFEWTDQFTRWCSTHGICGYPGLCRLHRAEILGLQGRVEEAESEALAAAGFLATVSPFTEGDAHRVLGDVRLSRGDLDGAESAFRRCHELGWDPNPGHAWLQMERGDVETALQSLERSLSSGEWCVRQRRAFVLAAVAEAAVRAGKMERAREALVELEKAPELLDTDAAAAAFQAARGELQLADDQPSEAVLSFRKAVQGWRELGSLSRMATVRLRLAEALAAAGDPHGADEEVAAAEATFEKAGFDAMVERCSEIHRRLKISEHGSAT